MKKIKTFLILMFALVSSNIFAVYNTLLIDGANTTTLSSAVNQTVSYYVQSTYYAGGITNMPITIKNTKSWITLDIAANVSTKYDTIVGISSLLCYKDAVINIITNSENTSTTSRNDTIIITSTFPDGTPRNITQNIIITQKSILDTSKLSVSATDLKVNSFASSTIFNINSNTSWTISSNKTWLTSNKTSGSGNANIILTAANNGNSVGRIALITVSGTNLNGTSVNSQTINVTQVGVDAPINSLSVSTTTLNVNATSNSTTSFNITSNTNWSISSNKTWLTANTTSGSGNANIILTANVNTSSTARIDTIIVSSTATSCQIIIVSQAGANVSSNLSVSPTSINIISDAGTGNFNITTNTSWTVSSNQTWLTSNTNSGSGNATITLTSTANTSTTARTATVTVKGTGVTDNTINVTQAGTTQVVVKHITINKIINAPIIDGAGTDAVWASQTANNITKSINDVSGISGNFKMCYDNLYVYILVNVNDNSLGTNGTGSVANDGNSYEGDCVELYFAEDTNNATAYTPGDWQIRKLVSKTQANGGIDGENSVSLSSLTSDANFKVVQTMGTNSYVQEWQIPIATLKQTANFDNKDFRFDIHLVNDSNGTKIGGLYWNSNADDQWSKVQNQGFIHLATAVTNHIIINEVSTAPVIDGTGTDAVWTSQTANNITQSINDVSGISGNFKMCYDNLYVYILVNVKDNSLGANGTGSVATDGNSYEGDCVELFFAADTNNATAYTPGDWQIRKLVSKTQANGGIDGENSVSLSSLTSDANFKVVQTMGTNSYVQEWQIPIATLKQTANFDNKDFRFDVHLVNDSNGTKIGGLYWNSNADDQWSKVQNQGFIHLATAIVTSTLSVSTSTLNVASTAGTTTFNITSNVAWTVVSNETWISVSKSSGSNNATITLTTTANTSTTTRTATITVSGTGVANKTLTVSQAGKTTTVKETEISKISIYPNPSTGIVNLKNTNGIVSVRIFDLNGRNVFTTNVSDNQVDLSNLKDGLYIMNVESEKASKYLKLVINKK